MWPSQFGLSKMTVRLVVTQVCHIVLRLLVGIVGLQGVTSVVRPMLLSDLIRVVQMLGVTGHMRLPQFGRSVHTVRIPSMMVCP